MLLKKEQVDKLLILHSGYKSVEEIADIMGLPISFIESELKRRGYRPIYAKDKQTAPYTLFTEYEKKGNDDMTKKKCLTTEQKAEIIKLREEGVRVSEIAERFDVIENTIYTVLKKYKEEITPAENEKEPDTVAAVTDSEQEDLVDIPTNIVTQETENVKVDDDLLPCAVVDAVANEMDRLYDRLTECDREMQRIKDARENAAKSLLELKAFLKKYGFGDIVKTLDLSAKRRALKDGQ